jgi:predicted  nucleic acid-binding Zn-ribbon protein
MTTSKKPRFQQVPRLPGRSKDIEALTNNLEVGLGEKGDGLDAFLRRRDAIDWGILRRNIRRGPNGDIITYEPTIGQSDTERPPKPTNVTAQGGFTAIILSWDYPTYIGHAFAEVFRSETDNYGTAEKVATVAGNVHGDIVDYDSQYYYWVRFVNVDNIAGPIHDTSGAYAETAPNISAVIKELSDELNETHLAQHLRDRIDLIDAPDTGLIDRLSEETAERIAAISQETADRIAEILATNYRIDANDTDILDLEQELTTLTATVDNLDVEGNAAAISGLDTRITQNESDITAQSSALTLLESNLSNIESDVTGNTSALSLLDTRVTSAEGSITSISTDFTTLQAGLTAVESGVTGNSSAIGLLDARVTATEDENVSHSSAITTLQNDLANLDVSGNAAAISSLDTRVTQNETDISSQSSDLVDLDTRVTDAQADATAAGNAASALDTRVTANESTISSHSSQLTQLNSDVSSAQADASAAGSAASVLDTRVTAAEGSITSQGSAITSIENDISGLQSTTSAHSSAISSANSYISYLDGQTTAQSTSISQLNTEVDGHTATLSVHASSINGLEAQWSVKAQVGDLVGGVGFYNNGSEIQFMVTANTFAVLDPEGDDINPFFVQDGGTWINTAMIRQAAIQVGQIETLTVDDISGLNADFVIANIGVGTINNAMIGDSIYSPDYFPGTSGWMISKNGIEGSDPIIECHNMYARGNIQATSIKADSVDIISSLMLKDQSVTLVQLAHSEYPFSKTGSSWSNLLSRSITIDAATSATVLDIGIYMRGLALLSAQLISGSELGGDAVYGEDSAVVNVRVRRNSTVIHTRQIISVEAAPTAGTEKAELYWPLMDAPGVGTFTYYLDVQVVDESGYNSATYYPDEQYLRVLAAKK